MLIIHSFQRKFRTCYREFNSISPGRALMWDRPQFGKAGKFERLSSSCIERNL
jgi:hypothetical protein